MTSVTSVAVQAPAKINLSLAVGPPREDGYHPLATVYQAVSLYDHVTAVPAPDGEVSLELTGGPPPDLRSQCRPGDSDVGDPTDVPTGDGNLAMRAARLLAERTGTADGVHLRLRKAIPVAGGLAGGSADAAAALVACDHLWRTGLSQTDLLALGAELGSDVPFCLVGGTAIGSGRGELVEPVTAAGTYHWVLALAHGGLSTPLVYAETDRLRGGTDVPQPVVPRDLLEALDTGDAKALGRALSNDLEQAAVRMRPELAEVLARGMAGGALGALPSGSGPTCIFLAADDAHAREIEAALADAMVARVCRAVCHATGPVAGARVVSSS